jgi:serine O-acetyltransferase
MYGKRNGLFVKWLTRSDEYYIRAFMVVLRHYEYYLNKRRSLLDFIPYIFYWWNYRRLKLKSQLFIMPNTVGPGFFPRHQGFVRIGPTAHLGRNCSVMPMVLIGKKMPGNNGDIIIGDDCYIGSGVTILGPITIGNNVTIGAGAVVNQDVPDNAIVAGVPAKVIKMKERENER